MIRLQRAKFQNFRLLRDVEVEFSTEPDRPLTVIRAENDTGKTTLMHGLSWALFGDESLPESRSVYRLHPIDWSPTDDGVRVPISATIEFSTVDDETNTEVLYELERRCVDELGANELGADGAFRPSEPKLTLLQHTDNGARPVSNPIAHVESLLPASLQDIFFIDGDRALRYIEATDEHRLKRQRVEKAVRSLLGLDLLEVAGQHMYKARREAVAKVKKLGEGTDIAALARDQERLEDKRLKSKDKLTSHREQRNATDKRHQDADKRLKEALAAGAGKHRQLAKKLEKAEKRLADERKQRTAHIKSHRRLLNTASLCLALAPSPVAAAAGMLADLEKRKEIPSTLPDVLADSLEREECICGADLSEGTEQRRHMQAQLDEARSADQSKSILTSLNEGIKRTTRESTDEDSWAARLRNSLRDLQRCKKRQTGLEEEVAELRAQIKGIKQTDLQMLEKTVEREKQELKRLDGDIARTEMSLKQLNTQIKKLEQSRRQAEAKNQRVRSAAAVETAANDVLKVLQRTVEILQDETLKEVSEQMNGIFMAMIIADEEAGSVIRKVELTREHDIVVSGPGDRTIDPDAGLNGASRRALTLAFILALVKVSGIAAPNIIDTPLGMMGLEVRQAVLRSAVKHSSQLVMFLTGSEILGVEDMLDDYGGRFYTLSNTAHYPTKLLNDPGTGKSEALICDCSHRQTCPQCERRVPMIVSRYK